MPAALAALDRFAAAAFVLWLALLPLDPAAPAGGAWPNLADATGMLLAALIIARGAARLMARPAAWILGAVFLWAASLTPQLSTSMQACHALLALLAFLALLVPRGPSARQFHAVLAGACVLALAVTVLAEVLGQGKVLSDFWNVEPQLAGGWRRWAGPTAHPNLLAYVCAVLLWAGLSWRWRDTAAARAACALAGLLAGVCLFGTLSRTGWALAAFVAVAGGAWAVRDARKHARPRLPLLLLLGAAALGFGGMVIARPDLIAARAASVERQVSPTPEALLVLPEANIVSRGNVYRDALALIPESPVFGYGLEAYARFGRFEALHAHQLGLDLLLTGGIPFFLAAAGGVVWLVTRGRGAFLRGLVLIALFSGLADDVFFFKWPAVWLAAAAGLQARRTAGSVAAWWARSARRARVRARIRRYGPVAALFMLLAFAYQLREDFSIDFHAYYGAMRWSEETGKPPYLAWTGKVFETSDEELAQYLRKYQTEALSAALQFLYPPTAFAQLRAFTAIDDPGLAARIWRLFNLASLGGAVILALQYLPRAQRAAAALPVCLLAASYSPVRDALWLGQTSVWVSFLILLFLWALRADRPALAGAALALAAGLKIYPGFWLIGVCLWPARAPRAVLAFAATLLAMGMLSVYTDGTEVWRSYWENVLSKMGDAPPPGGVTLYPEFAGGASWSGRLVPLGVLAVSAMAFFCLREHGTMRKLHGVIAASAALFLVLPLVWAHYLVLPGVLLAAACVRWVPAWPARAPLGLPVLAAAYVLTGQMWLLEAVAGQRDAAYPRAGLAAAALVPLAFAAWARLYSKRRGTSP